MEAGEVVRRDLPDALDRLRGYAVRFVGRQEANDLLQAAALRALDKAHQFTPGTNFGAWLYVIMRSEVYTRHRNNKRRATLHIDDVPQEFLGRDGVQEKTVDLAEAERLLGQMPALQREVVKAAAQGHTYEDMAEHFGVSVGTLKSRLWRGRARIREAVA